jgi:hypothetical protein
MFSESLTLKDWSVDVNGKKEVLRVIKSIFDSTNSIRIEPLNFFSNSEDTYAVSINIYINETLELKVIDIINFDSNGKISKICAFKD